MNTNPNAIKVLCFGDSNTWGQRSDQKGRYPADTRWTGVLQRGLGEKYYVVEEGLNSRTTDLEYVRKPGRNGKAYLIPCLNSHTPVDVVVLMLGTNDLKTEFNRSAEDVANSISGLVNDIRTYALNKANRPPKIILVSPIVIDGQASHFTDGFAAYYGERSIQESQRLAGVLAATAQELGCEFVDAATVARAGDDGIHLNLEAHASLAAAIQAKV